MPFDMYAGELRESIGHHEEFLLQLACNDTTKYPELCALSDVFYSNPVISDEKAGRLVHELIELLDAAGKENKALVVAVVRLLPFFSRAYRQKRTIRCVSD